MTYGSQAAAASHVFEQQRDLALREHTQHRGRGRRRRPRAPGRRHLRRVHGVRRPDRRRSGSRRCPGRPCASTASARRPAVNDRAGAEPEALPALVTIDDDPRRGGDPARDHPPDAAGPVRPPRAPPLAQGRVAPADRRVQAARRVRRGGLADAGGAGPRAHHLLVRQPRPGRRPRGAAARRPGRHRHAVRRAGHQARARRGRRRRDRRRRHGVRGAAAGRRGARRRARPGDHPALRRPADHRRPGHRRASRSPRTCRTWPPCSCPIGGGGLAAGVRGGDHGARPGRADHRRRAGAGGRRARVAGAGPDRRAGRRSS